jgi:hypothetical protein
MSDTPQFFREPSVLPAQSERTDRALYRIPNPDGGEELLIMAEVVEGTGNVPQNATSFIAITQKQDLEKQLNTAASMARVAVDAMRKLTPGEVQIEFGIELGGEMGFPTITKVQGEANFKITLKWKQQESKAVQ